MALPSSRPRSSARLSSTERAGSERASRSSGLSVDAAARTRTARPRARPPGRPARRCVRRRRPRGARGRRRGRGWRPSDGRPPSTRGRADAGSSLSPKICRTSSALASAVTERSVATRRRPGSAAQDVGDPEEVVGRPEPRPHRRRPLSRRASVSDRERVGRGATHQFAPPPFGGGHARATRGRRGSARRRGSGEPSSSSDSPTMRPASEVASAPTSARSEVTACWRSASIWVLRVLDDARRLGLRLLAHLRDDRRTLLARLLADAGGLVPGVAELLLELGELGVGLGLLGLGRLQPALDRGGPLGERLLEVGDDPLLDREEQQAEDDQRRGRSRSGAGSAG